MGDTAPVQLDRGRAIRKIKRPHSSSVRIPTQSPPLRMRRLPHVPAAVPALTAVVFGLLLGACQSPNSSPSAAAVIDSARAAHGASVLNRAVVTFDFRGDAYRTRQDGGVFHYRRAYTDSLGRAVTEGLTNDGPYRVVEGDTVSLTPSERASVETTVNSVAYFALLPAPLGDQAVQPSYSGRDTIDGVPYHRVRVTFRQEGGGADWEDVFVYWFRAGTYDMDYLAYAFGQGPNEEAGTRFREAYNVRRRGGVRVADYHNYTADTLTAGQMAQYPDLLKKDVERVSEIEVDSVQVRPL